MYQALGEANDARAYPPPGAMVDVGGHKLHLHCTGENSPTVILETLSGGMSPYWAWVQPEIAKTTRVCVYDRAGRAWSEASQQPQTLEGTARELRTLLTNANIAGPFVLVGHSIGDLYVREFQALYPDEVAGIVLVDASHPEQLERFPALAAGNQEYLNLSAIFPPLARLGIARLFFDMGGEFDFQDLPRQEHAEVAAFFSTPRYFESQRAEMAAATQIFNDARKLGVLGDLPLIVITAGSNTLPGWKELQIDLATLSTNSLHRTIDGAAHASLAFNSNDAQQVSALITQMVEAIRKGQRLTQEE
ncbi:MAG: putative aminoacrylate hydrolase RutD [Anaerolineae bacterium]|nr:putative aminoacrylate hydrolase RutD [Anaerolineae bacterium]